MTLRTRAALIAVAVAVVVVDVGCATAGAAAPSASVAREFVPLAVGARWSYRVTPGPAEPQEVAIVDVDDAGYFVNNRGERLAPRSDGVFDGTRFVIKDPVEVGATWVAVPKGQPTERYSITATDVDVTVAAGRFAGCVEVEGAQAGVDPNTGKPGKLFITWTYARGVGLIKVVQKIQVGGDAPVVGATMELVSFTPAPAATR